MDMTPEALFERSAELFNQRGELLSLWQEIALNFYPQRAHFTSSGSDGKDFASHLMSSKPLLYRRKFANIIGYMLRADKWFEVTVKHADRIGDDSRKWLEQATRTQYDAMYDRAASFTRVTKQGDNDYSAFGQNVISTDISKSADALLFKNFNIRDCAWSEGENGAIEETHVQWKPSAIQLLKMFGDSVSSDVKKLVAEGKPYTKVNCRHIVMPWENYSEKPNPTPRLGFVSIHMEEKSKSVLEEKQVRRNRYNVARWETVSGSPYAHSPAVMAALPDARLLQAMTLVLLQAGEKAVDPPMVGIGEAFRSDLNFFPGGFTSVDIEYADRLGEVLRPVAADKSGFPMGMELLDRVTEGMAELFFLNELQLPSIGSGDRTAYEFSQRVQESARATLPILEPIEADYNGGLCESAFWTGFDNGFFGRMQDMPEELLGRDIEFSFKSPYRDALSRADAAKLGEALEVVGGATQFDPNAGVHLDVQMAVRDTLKSVGVPADWLRDEKQVASLLEQGRQQEQQQAAMEQAAQVADMAGKAGLA